MAGNEIKKKILIIDDEELINRSLSKLLSASGYEVVIAKSGQGAINLAHTEKFNLIISDIRMPGVSGIDAVKGIYTTLDGKNFERPPVIFITGYADEKCEEEANGLKPIDYIYKPFDIRELIDRVNNVLGK